MSKNPWKNPPLPAKSVIIMCQKLELSQAEGYSPGLPQKSKRTDIASLCIRAVHFALKRYGQQFLEELAGAEDDDALIIIFFADDSVGSINAKTARRAHAFYEEHPKEGVDKIEDKLALIGSDRTVTDIIRLYREEFPGL